MHSLPEFPWDRLAPYKHAAARHSGGLVDLSIGTPVDPTPQVVQRAIRAASNAPGYPATYGTPRLREAAAGWLWRRLGVAGADPDAVLPLIGTKQFVAWLPTLIGAGEGDVVAFPELAYPTYDVGARLAGATPMAADGLFGIGPITPKLVWLNSPSNPTGQVLPAEHLRKTVAWARERGVLLVNDECYIELGWSNAPDDRPISILHPEVCEGSHEGLLAVHSLSKRSNMAGYRAGFVSGDPAVVKALLGVSRHAGMMVPGLVQAAMIAALGDDAHADEQRARYARRRAALRKALTTYGFHIDHSEAALYLWATLDEPCWDTVGRLADIGILVAPGEFYGAKGDRHVRVAFTATDEDVAAAVRRLAPQAPPSAPPA